MTITKQALLAALENVPNDAEIMIDLYSDNPELQEIIDTRIGIVNATAVEFVEAGSGYMFAIQATI